MTRKNGPADLAGKTIVVTGVAGGQGTAEAQLLLRCGAHVIGTDITDHLPWALTAPDVRPDQDHHERGADHDHDSPGILDYRVLDVAEEAHWQALARDLTDRQITVHGLVNNAGITHRARLGQTTVQDWNRVISINMTGPMLAIQALAPLMVPGSSIVNIGSAAGLNAHYTAAYTASKWGLRGLTHVAATQYGPRGIRVNIVHPGYIQTAMTSNAPDAMRAAQLALTPLERLGNPEEVASVVAFLLSEGSAYISGAEIPVDGAFTSSAGVKYMADQIAAATSPTS